MRKNVARARGRNNNKSFQHIHLRLTRKLLLVLHQFKNIFFIVVQAMKLLVFKTFDYNMKNKQLDTNKQILQLWTVHENRLIRILSITKLKFKLELVVFTYCWLRIFAINVFYGRLIHADACQMSYEV